MSDTEELDARITAQTLGRITTLLECIPTSARTGAHEMILQHLVHRMVSTAWDVGLVRALVTQAADPKWRGEPLRQRRV